MKNVNQSLTNLNSVVNYWIRQFILNVQINILEKLPVHVSLTTSLIVKLIYFLIFKRKYLLCNLFAVSIKVKINHYILRLHNQHIIYFLGYTKVNYF